jgi:hypothetical protein
MHQTDEPKLDLGTPGAVNMSSGISRVLQWALEAAVGHQTDTQIERKRWSAL